MPDLAELEHEIAELDTALRPITTEHVDLNDRDWVAKLQARLAGEPAVQRSAEVLAALIDAYAAGTAPVRDRIRAVLDRHRSFRWAAHLPRDWTGVEQFRARIIHMSMRDQDTDTRDELLTLRDLCARASAQGIDVTPVLAEVALMSSDDDRYGMGSMRRILLRHSHL